MRSGDKSIITSNRDEKSTRPSSFLPELYSINNKKLYFPKDPQSGGTWFAIDETGNVAVLLNGSFEKHDSLGYYLRSRGLILLDIISESDLLRTWEKIDLKGIEPFTIVILIDKHLFQLNWDYSQKYTCELDSDENHIWSSVTLYNDEAIKQREEWFNVFQAQNRFPDENEMRDFHLNTHSHDSQNGLVINREDIVLTQSVTQAVIEKNRVSLFYHDILKSSDFSKSFIII